MSGITPRASLDSLPKAPATFALPSYMQCIQEDLASPGLSAETKKAALLAADEDFRKYPTAPDLQEVRYSIRARHVGRHDDEMEAAQGLVNAFARCRTTSCEPTGLASPRSGMLTPRTIAIQSPSTISGSPATGSMGYMVPYSPAQKQVVGTPTLS